MSDQKRSKVPQIRFKGFVGEWEHLELRNVSEIKTGPFGSALHASDYVQDGVPIVTTEHFKNWHLPSSKTGLPQVSAKDYERLQNYVLKYGDLVFSRVGSIDINAHVEKTQNGWLFSGRVLRVRGSSKFNGEYLHHELSTWRVRRSVATRSVGQTMPCINTEILGATPISVPDSPAEQTQIGGYFRELDSLIGLHQRKHDKLVTLKKAMLQKMFPQPGATTPEIRFKGFSGDWEEKRLGELCELFTDGDWIESKDQSTSGIRLLQTGNVGVNEFIDKADKARWISLDTFERLKCEEVFAGDILISRLPEPAGRACIVPKLSHRVITAVDCTIVRTAKSCDPAFLVQHCSLDSYFETVNNYLGGGTRQRISRSALGKFVVKIPQFEEQQKIGTYFRTLDELISQHASQLQKLQQIKSACLEKMFV